MGQCTTKPTIRLVWRAKTQIRLRICAVWSESLLITCAFYSSGLSRGINKNPCHIGWIYRLIWVIAGYSSNVGFVMRWIICFCAEIRKISETFWLKTVPYKEVCIRSPATGVYYIQSTLVISNSKGLTETLRDIRTSTYQSWESEENNKLNNHI